MDICVWDKCNNFCVMCTNPDKPWISSDGQPEQGYEYKVLIERIKRLKNRVKSNDAVILTGGEPTLHPQFLDVLKFVRKTFPKQELRILTNGRMFSYLGFAQEVLKTEKIHLAVSLYGPTPEIHESVTRAKNSFEQTVKGLKNILANIKKDQSIEIRIVISKLSYKYLEQFLNLTNVHFPSVGRIIFIFIEHEGQAAKNLKSVHLTYSKVRPYLNKIYPFFSQSREIRLYHFPLCTIDPKFWPFVWRTLPDKEVTFIPSCRKCKYKKYCLGIHRDHPNKVKGGEFNPVKDDLVIEATGDFYHPIIKVSKK